MWISKKEYDELNAIKVKYVNAVWEKAFERTKAPVCEAEKRFFGDCEKKNIIDLKKEIDYLKKCFDVSEKEVLSLRQKVKLLEVEIEQRSQHNQSLVEKINKIKVINDLNEAIKSCKVDLSFTCKEKPNSNPPDEIKLKNSNPVEIIESEFKNGGHYITFKFKEK